MLQGSLTNTSILCFFFAATYLIAGRRTILARSTRLLLTFLLAGAGAYVLTEHSVWHAIIGTGVLILNVLFGGFALIDYVNWHRARAN